MAEMRLLPGERLESELRPHPLAWGGRYFIGAWPAILGILLAVVFRTEWWQTAEEGKWFEVWTWLYGNTASAVVYMFIGLLLMGAIIAVAAIRWRTFFAYALVGLLVTAAMIVLDVAAEQVVPLGLAVASLPFLLTAELDRRSHQFVLTNLRIVFRGGMFVRHERQLKYESITDLDGSQGLFGRIFDFGTLIPITQSGFGLGSDSSEAGIAVGGGGSKGGLFGGAAVTAGGGKEVQTGRARTFQQLTGVRPYEETKYLLERLVQEATSTPYLREQVELQREMLEHMRAEKQARSEAAHQSAPQRAPRAPPRPTRDEVDEWEGGGSIPPRR